jgi:hypothetical protein
MTQTAEIQRTRLPVAVVAHTHWDREWYAPFQTFRLALVDLLDELLDLLEAEPPFRCFLLDGQMAMVDDYLEVRPENEARLRRLVTSERLVVGPFYVLADEFLVSGETLVRNLELGLERAATLGGAMPVGYLPDMFGHAAQMPQLLRLFGFEHAVVWRGVPFAVNRTAFWWSAPDGSTVRAEYLISSYSNGARIGPDERDLLGRLEADEAKLGPALAGRRLVMAGHDHQPPKPFLPAVIERANESQDRYELRMTTLVEALAAGATEGLPSWQGELRSSARANLLMGVTSNRLDVRRAAASAERALERRAEPLSALFLPPERWPKALLDVAWREVVRNAAHDSVCACSADETVAAVLERYREGRQLADGLSKRALSALARSLSHSGQVVVNPTARARGGMVEVSPDGAAPPGGTQEAGEGRVLARVEGVPGFGWAAWRPSPPQRPVRAERRGMANGLCTVEVDPADGTFSIDGHGGLGRLVDGGDAGDTYNWSPPDVDELVDRPERIGIEVAEEGPVRARIELHRRYLWPERVEETSGSHPAGGDGGRRNTCRAGIRPVEVTTSLELRAGERFVRLTVAFDNAHRDHRLRALFPLPAPATSSEAECAFAVVERGLEAEGGEGEVGVPTFPARRFVRAGRITIVHDGVLEYELVDVNRASGRPEAHAVAITLLRATGMLSRGPMTTRSSPAGPELPLEGPQLQGRMTSRLAVGLDVEDPYAFSDEVLCPLEVVRATGAGSRSEVGSALTVEGAEVAAVRRRPGGLEVRVFNPTPTRTTVGFGGRSGSVLDLRGTLCRTFVDLVELGPWAIATVLLPDR